MWPTKNTGYFLCILNLKMAISELLHNRGGGQNSIFRPKFDFFRVSNLGNPRRSRFRKNSKKPGTFGSGQYNLTLTWRTNTSECSRYGFTSSTIVTRIRVTD